MFKKTFAFIFLSSLLFACAPSRIVKPLSKGETNVAGSFGGSLIHFSGLIIPIPFTTLCVAHGIDSTTTVFGSVHTTSLAFGNIQTDLGCTKQILKPKGKIPGVSLTPAINAIWHMKSTDYNIFPQLDANAYWNYGQRGSFFYAGLSGWFDFNGKKAFNEKNTHHVIPSVQIGNTWTKEKWKFTIETKIIAPNLSNKDIVAEYVSLIPGKGAQGVFFAVSRRFK